MSKKVLVALTVLFIVVCFCLTEVAVLQAATIADVRADYVAGTNEGDPGTLPATGIGTWSYLASDDLVGASFNETVTVSVGSTVDFVIGSNDTDTYDSTALKATITPEPATVGLILLGGVAMLIRKRK